MWRFVLASGTLHWPRLVSTTSTFVPQDCLQGTTYVILTRGPQNFECYNAAAMPAQDGESPFRGLPAELLLQIVEHLDRYDRLDMRLVCRSFWDLSGMVSILFNDVIMKPSPTRRFSQLIIYLALRPTCKL